MIQQINVFINEQINSTSNLFNSFPNVNSIFHNVSHKFQSKDQFLTKPKCKSCMTQD